ncbi:MAG: DUF6452 family protein [Bacteroidota bacterium]
MNKLSTPCLRQALWVLLMSFAGLGCKDLEDVRPTYPTHVHIDFQNLDLAQVDRIVCSLSGTKVLHKADIIAKYSRNGLLALPLNAQSDQTTYQIYKQHGHRVDTLTLHYKRLLALISPQAGLQYMYTLSHLETTFSGYAIVRSALKHTFPKPDVEVYC